MVRDLSEIRGEIDRTDDEILRLLNQRARLVAEVATVKQQLQVPFYVPSRERQITERLSAANAAWGRSRPRRFARCSRRSSAPA